MATPQQLTNYIRENEDVRQSADAIALSVAPRGTPQFIETFQNALINHARDFGVREGRAGATELFSGDTVNPGDGTTVDSTTLSLTAPPPLDPVDLTPITSAIGTPTTAQTDANQTTLMGQTAGLATGQQGIRDVVDPLAGQVTGIGTSIGTAGTGQADTLMGQTADIQSGIGTANTDAGQTDLFAGQRGIMSGIGTAGTDTTPGTGLVGGQANIQAGIGTAGEGQTDLFAGQAGLQSGQAGLQSGQQAMQATQAGLEAGQLGLGTQIGALGTAAVTGEDGTVTQKPTGLYAGQAGLMSGQTGLGTQLTGVGRDITAELGDVSSTLGGQIGAFQTAAEQYQRGATTQRGDIQGTQRANQAAMTQQVQGVGQQANRTAEMMAQQRQQPAVQQQAAQFAQSAPRATPSNQQVGPMGPMSVDPRDAIIRQLMANRTGLMNRRPI
tara:strand:+ start:43 stop:1365 length:1323 start_codon:yes stop_codon:yes gene_type:complete